MPLVLARLLFAGTIFTSAFLLFLVQPLIAKQILPWFGGSAAVWAVCMVFFQVVLLAGYAYSDWVSRNLSARRQVAVHIGLLLTSLVFVPIVAASHWKPGGAEEPTLWILGLLVGTIGLPYFLLSTTGPLIQTWVARAIQDAHVYRYFALSNLASLVSLIAYPFVIEPRTALLQQAYAWSWLYGLFVLLCSGAALNYLRHLHTLPPPAHAQKHNPEGGWVPGMRDYLLWLGLSAMGSWLLLAITNHMTQNVAAIPFLWLLPLTIYLLTFVLCFESDRWYRRNVFLLPAGLLLAFCAYALGGVSVKVAIPLYAVGLFFFCMFLHGELARLRPGPRYLTRFYLMMSLGGALGGIAVGLVAPRVLPAYYELGIGLVITALLAMALLWERKFVMMAGGGLAILSGYFLFVQIGDDFKDARRMERSFYGALLTVDVKRDNPDDNVRQFYHGSVKHGEQFLSPARQQEPTAYYGPSAGIGRAIASSKSYGKKVGLIGMGVGTLALYGRAGDVYRFYEIDPAVIELARTEFTFIGDSRARVETVLGDARLSLERESSHGFDVLAVDAFSGDSIPVHLITTEAMEVYLKHMNPDGIIAFHVTNKFLWLPPVVARIAAAKGLHAVLIQDENDNPALRNTDWVLVAANPHALERELIRQAAISLKPDRAAQAWTDDFNNLFDALK